MISYPILTRYSRVNFGDGPRLAGTIENDHRFHDGAMIFTTLVLDEWTQDGTRYARTKHTTYQLGEEDTRGQEAQEHAAAGA